jgi:hypothetical protein
VLFVCDDIFLVSHAPLGLENAIHGESSLNVSFKVLAAIHDKS